MEYFAGIDVSLEASSVCLVDAAGKIIRETKVASDPDALIEHFVWYCNVNRSSIDVCNLVAWRKLFVILFIAVTGFRLKRLPTLSGSIFVFRSVCVWSKI